MSSSALTSDNSAVVMIDHAVGFGNVFRSHDLSLHVNNTVGLAKTAGVFGIPLVLTNGADTGPYGPLFSELRAVTGGVPMIVREGNFINAFETPEFAAAIESAGRRKLVMSGLLTEGCVLGTALAGLERGYEVYVAVDATAGETLEIHQVAVQRMVQAGVVPVTWLSLASQYQGSYTNHETVPGFLGLMAQHSPTLGMLFQGHAAPQAAPAAPSPDTGNTEPAGSRPQLVTS
jgi:nicotinamidase-related amidase